jgi:hypothetical protein
LEFRTVVEKDTGLRRQVEVNKRVNQWWVTTDSGNLALSVRYGARLLGQANGKYAMKLTSEKKLAPSLEIIKVAVLSWESDVAIDAASNNLRDGFQQ